MTLPMAIRATMLIRTMPRKSQSGHRDLGFTVLCP
jgi:hypothetical protein